MTPQSPLEKIRQALGGGNPQHVRQALNAIARHRIAQAAPLLQALLRTEQDPELRYLANKVLNFLVHGVPGGNPSTAGAEGAPSPREDPEPIIEAVDPSVMKLAPGTPLVSPDPRLRLKAVMLLIQNPQTAAYEVLAALAETEKDAFVRSALPMALVRIGGNEVLPLIVRSFLEDPHPRVRANAVEALSNLEDLRAAPFLVKMVSDIDHRTRANAVVGLQRFSKGKVWKILEAMVASTQVWMRDSAAYALGRLKDPRGVALLGRLLQDPYETVTVKARAALEVMAEAGNSEAEFLLASITDIPMEESWDSLVKLTAASEDQGCVMAIGTGTDRLPVAEEPSDSSLDESAPGMLGGLWTASAAQAALTEEAEEGEGAAPPPADYALSDPDPERRLAELSRAIGDGTAEAAQAIAERLAKEEDEEILVAFLDALTVLGHRITAEAVHPFLEHRSSKIICCAIRAVRAFEDSELDGWLIPLLKDRRAEIKVEAAKALRACQYADYLGALKELALDQKADRALLALEAAREIANPLMVTVLEILARHHVHEVQEGARATLQDMAKRGRKSAQRALDALDGYS